MLLWLILLVSHIISIEVSNQYSYAVIIITPIVLLLAWLAQKDISRVGDILNSRVMIYLRDIFILSGSWNCINLKWGYQ